MGAEEDLKLFGMQNLLLESELKKLEESGVQIEHAKTIRRAEIVDVELFEIDIVQEARRMGRFLCDLLRARELYSPSNCWAAFREAQYRLVAG